MTIKDVKKLVKKQIKKEEEKKQAKDDDESSDSKPAASSAVKAAADTKTDLPVPGHALDIAAAVKTCENEVAGVPDSQSHKVKHHYVLDLETNSLRETQKCK